jgi:putative DNA primase/helicase
MSGLDQTDWPMIAPDVGRILLGEPNKALSGKRELRWGNHGSIALKIATGQFYDHEANEGGGVAWLIEHRGAGPVRRFLAENEFSEGTVSLDRYRVRKVEAQKAETQAARRKRDRAAGIWASGVPIEGTPAEVYLRSRGIDRWPSDAVRYSGGALVFPFKNDAGDVIAIQRIVLDAQGRKATKLSLGPIGKAKCILPGAGVLHLCEGPETGLSVWMATGAPVMICAGPISASRIGHVEAGPIVLASDAAEDGAPVAKTFAHACEAATNAGLTWRSAIPDGKPGTDWNDVLQAHGLDAVRARLGVGDWIKPQAPIVYPATYAAPQGGVDDARLIVEATLQKWAAGALDWVPPIEGEDNPARPPIEALRVSTGVGKSYAARVQVVAMVKELRARGDSRSIAVAVPRHDLGSEFVQEIKALGVTAEAWKSRMQTDPEQPGLSMCHRPKDADAAQKAGVDVSGTLCRAGAEQCAFFESCGYQKMQAKRPDVWIVPQAMLWNAPPKAIRPAALIVDEDPTGDIFGGFDGRPYALSLHDLGGALLGLAEKDPDTAADLERLTSALAAKLGEQSGKVRVHDIRSALGGGAADVEALRNRPYKAKIARPASPMTTGAELVNRLEEARPVNDRVKKTARLLGMVSDAMSADLDTVLGLSIETMQTPEGDGYKVARMKWRNRLHEGWAVPTIIMSATLQEQLLRHIWPELGAVTNAEAAMPHVKIRQITDSANAKSSLLDGEGRKRGRIKRIAHYVEARVFELGGRWLVVAQKDVVEALRPHLPTAALMIDTAHFNALSGLDEWCDVRGIIIIGRTQPSPRTVEAMAEMLTGRPAAVIEGDWYEKTPGALNMHGTGEGPGVFSQKGHGGEIIHGVDRHPDPIAELLRWSICEGELIQTAGRGRGVNRTSEAPLQIDLLTHIPLPFAVAEAGAFADFEPMPLGLLAARGVIPEMGAKGAWQMVAAILPDLFPSSEAAREMGKERSSGGNRISSIYGSPRVSGYMPGRAKLSGARYAVPVLLRDLADLRCIDPGATFEPDAVPASHVRRASMAIGPELEPFMEPPPRIEPFPTPPPVPLGCDEAEECAAFLEADGVPRREAERIARQSMDACRSGPRRALIWVISDAARPPLRGSRVATLYHPDLSGTFALARYPGAIGGAA